MLFLLGVIIVAVSVIVGYTMHAGNLRLLWQPNELLIILGTGIGSVLISNSWYTIKSTVKSLIYLFKGIPYKKEQYIELLLLIFALFRLIKTKGILAIEDHLENPHGSSIFAQAKSVINNERVLDFIRDNLRLITMGVDQVYQFEEIIDKEIENFANEVSTPSRVFLNLGEALPALGIVAAVLGVIVTMRSISEPPEILGSLIGAALVGTFTGVLLSYGFVMPIGNFFVHYSELQVKYLECIKSGFVSYLHGNNPAIVIEFMRKSIPEEICPTFDEVEYIINNTESIK